MSSIQANAAVVRGLLAIPRNAAAPQSGPRRFTQSTDQALMHAWSIGTTRAAQNPDHASASEKSGSQKQASRSEDCPPEVYIG